MISTPKEILGHDQTPSCVHCPTCYQETLPVGSGQCGWCNTILLRKLPGIGWIYDPCEVERSPVEAKKERRDARPEVQALCGHCMNSFMVRPGPNGVPRRFCTPKCKQRSYKQRKKAERAAAA